LQIVRSRCVHEFEAEEFQMRRRCLISAKSLLFALLFLTLIPAGTYALSPVNVDERGVAVKGYDVVAYFTVGEPVEGSSRFAFEWNGATWWFSNRKHLELFQGDQEKYAPRYGGY
jgi:YHS domain-containing protein